MEVDIVIVNWNSGSFLRRCVSSVFRHGNTKCLHRLWIIDNHSADDSMDGLPEDPRISIIRNTENRGFARACNQGFVRCEAPYVLLLNPDAELGDHTLAACTEFMDTNAGIDIMGCRLVDDHQRTTSSCSRFPSPLRIFFDAAGLSKIFPKLFHPATVMTDWDHSESRYTNQVMGAFMFIRKGVFERIGYFDERFFVYFEEVDFCKRLHDAGGKVFYNYSITAVHTGEGTTRSVKAFRLFLSLQSRLRYAKKHFSAAGFGVVWYCTFLLEPLTRSGMHLLRLDLKSIGQVIRAIQLLIRQGY
jgi:GT2 family glycosyltransferase